LVLGAVLTSAGSVMAAQEPHVIIAPAPGKPPDLFEQEDEACRAKAEESSNSDAGTEKVVESAAVGTVIGAAAGSLMGGRHDRGGLTGAGALTGLIVGAAAGANRNAAADAAAQRHYDRVYLQCMLAKGNQLPGAVVRQVAPPPAPMQNAPAVMYPPPPPSPPPSSR
jgi:hypothetical protein